tara:strand:+ start:989 stop:1570 length:582 start_codon:yes stop_codon:yes gene_type:complete
MENKCKIILASSSPRRAEILNMIGINFRIIPSNIREKINDNIAKNKIAENLSRKKAEKISQKYPNDIIIGADTIVMSKEKIFGKPKDQNESKIMLKTLSGKSHKVITGVTLINQNIKIIKTFSEVTEVFVRKIPDNQINYYVENFNTLDKAGSYGIQEWFSVWIKKINGCFYNVMGLPASKFYKHFVSFQNRM